MFVNVTWNDAAFVASTRREIADKLDAVGNALAMALQVRVSIIGKGPNGETVHSPEGKFTYLQTGNLQDAIQYEVTSDKKTDALSVKVGVFDDYRDQNVVAYARFLEFGTEKMAERPWLRTILDTEVQTVKRIIES